jgi:DNA polymerase III delta prime subunit
MALKAVKPEIVKPSKPKFLISGPSGVGKTTFGLEFPKPYLIDVEGGAVREQYTKKLIASGGAYFGKEQGSQDFKLVIEEIKALATSKHDYKTLIIDSFTKLYNMAAAIAEETVGNDFGRDKKEANKPTRQLIRWLEKIDMTVILICHMKPKYERQGKEIVYAGTTFDGWDKLEYDLDLWIEIHKTGKRTLVCS